MRHKLPLGTALAGVMIVSGVLAPWSAASGRAHSAASPATVASAVRPPSGVAAGGPFCQGLRRGILRRPGGFMASAGAIAYCHPPARGFGAPVPAGVPRSGTAPARSGAVPAPAAAGPAGRPAPANADAANPAEDVTSSGVRGYGQSDTSVAAAGRYVVEAWDDDTALFSACPSPEFKEEFTGLGFSANGGKSFTDLGGLPNNGNCHAGIYMGDPSVTAYQVGGHTYFYVTSLFDSPARTGRSFVKLAACAVEGRGTGASLRCGQPVTVAASTVCITAGSFSACDFLDKPFAAIDPAHRRLYVSYTRFNIKTLRNGGGPGDLTDTELSACDLGSKTGGPGQGEGTPAAPVCTDGAAGRAAPFTVAHGDPARCESEGAYPAADTVTGVVYVGYEFNWVSNTPATGTPACLHKPAANVITMVPARCLPLSGASPCRGPAATRAVPVTSLDGAVIPGWSAPGSFPNDFPRVAVSGPAKTVSMVWNDAGRNPLGDILMQSFALRTLAPLQRHPVVLNTWAQAQNLFPAVRTATASGRLDVTWYTRGSPNTAVTGVAAALGLNPRQSTAPPGAVLLTRVPTDWNATDISLIGSAGLIPNFGDYTDNAVAVTGQPPFAGSTLYVTWTDGRLGIPQPFVARLPAG